MIVEAATFVTLLGGGDLDPADLSKVLHIAPRLVAADGGADAALAAGFVPDAVIGDLDSLSASARAELAPETVHHIAEQDSTDFEKALRSVQAPGVVALGFTGARVDHELAVYNTLVKPGFPPCLVLGARDLVFAAPPGRKVMLQLEPEARVSLFPMMPVRGRGRGLHWPIDEVAFAPGGPIGTSNRALSGQVEMVFDGPGMLVILPRAHLRAAISAAFEFPLSPAAATR